MTNRSWTWTVAASAIALSALVGCKKKEESTPAPAAEPAPAAPPPAAAPAAPAAPDPNAAAAAPPTDGAAPPGDGEVKRYPNETPVGHTTVRAVVPFNVYQEADLVSQKLGAVAAGTFVNVMATYSNWILVEWPSGVGELSPGWAPIPNVYDKRLALATTADRDRLQRDYKRRERPAGNRIKVRPKRDK